MRIRNAHLFPKEERKMAKSKKNKDAVASELTKDAIKAATDARTAYEDVVTRTRDAVTAEKRTATDEESTAIAEARKAYFEAEERANELIEEDKRNRRLEKQRRAAGLDVEDGDGTMPRIKVGKEPRTYGEGSPNSYFADFVRSSDRNFHDFEGAKARLARHATEVSYMLREKPNSAEAQRAARSVREDARGAAPAAVESRVSTLRARYDAEIREGMDTTATSGGSFVTPQYFVSDYAPYRQFGRVFIDQCNKQGLPDYGMEIYIPALSGPAGIASQASQNTGIEELDPTALYLSSALNTLAGQVVVSQQLLDRAGPNFQFDKMVFDQLNRAYCQTVDNYVLTQAVAAAGQITATSTLEFPYLYQKLAQARSYTATTEGTVLPATHAFFTTTRWEYNVAQYDTNGKPFVQPDYAGVFQALAAGSNGTPVVEGDTGYRVSGLKVFEDNEIPNTTSGYDQVVVAHMPEVWVWEGDLVPRTIPQTYAQDLSVLLQLYAYVTVIVRYPLAVQVIQANANVSWPA
jgi:hypothetical protein